MIKQYRKKPVVIEAVLWDGKIDTRNLLREWCDNSTETVFLSHGEYNHPYIKTLEGEMKISPGDYIIKGVKGEFYPCKPDIFDATYEAV